MRIKFCNSSYPVYIVLLILILLLLNKVIFKEIISYNHFISCVITIRTK